MARTDKQTFLQGALILILANGFVKIIGAIFKIPLDNLIGADGMGLFTVAYNLYSAMFVLSTAGLPVAVSRMVAEANALGKAREVRLILKISFVVFVGVGAVGSLGMFFGAGAFVRSIPNIRALYAVICVAPSIFFVAVMSVFRGYYQGLSNMIPTAVSQLIEAACKLLLGYGFAFAVLKAGYGVEYAAAGAILGITLGSLFGSVFLICRFKRSKGVLNAYDSHCRTAVDILKNLVRIAVPITVGSAVLSVTNFIDMYVVLGRLQEIGFSETLANTLYGAYSVKAVSLMSMPQTLITALSVSLIPAIASAYATKLHKKAAETSESALRITMLIAVPCAVGIGVMADSILHFLFRSEDEISIAAPLLRMLSPAIVCIALVSVTTAILQAVGKERVAVFSMLAGGVVKLCVNYVLIGMEEINISGAPIGTVLCYLTIAVINLLVLTKTEAAPKRWISLLKPCAAAGMMGIFSYLCRNMIFEMFGNTLTLFITILLSAFVYLGGMLLVRGLYREDIMMLPKGRKIADILHL